MITSQVKDLCYGLYGKTAVPIDPEVQAKALKDYPRGTTPISTRPADVLEPEMDKAKKDTEGLARDIDDTLIYALYPTTGKRFLRWKYGLEAVPEEVKPVTLEMVQAQDDLVRKAKEGLLTEKPKETSAGKGPEARSFRIFMNGNSIDVAVEQIGGEPLFIQAPHPVGQKNTLQLGRQQVKTVLMTTPSKRDVLKFDKTPVFGSSKENVLAQTPVLAPMPGLVVRYVVKEGDPVSKGDAIVILEAMKMENYINSPVSGTVQKIMVTEGTSAKKGEALALIV
jgi:pyruvate carboxylase subunit B